MVKYTHCTNINNNKESTGFGTDNNPQTTRKVIIGR